MPGPPFFRKAGIEALGVLVEVGGPDLDLEVQAVEVDVEEAMHRVPGDGAVRLAPDP